MTFRDIEISMTQQCMFFIYSIALGIVCGMIYDIFRIFRIAVRHNGVAVFFEDLLFCLICGVLLILFVFCANYGILRWFCFFGWSGGFYVYYLTVGKSVISAAGLIIGFIRRYVIYPVIRMVYVCVCAVLRFASALLKRLSYRFNELRKYILCRRRIRQAARGFGIKI